MDRSLEGAGMRGKAIGTRDFIDFRSPTPYLAASPSCLDKKAKRQWRA
jgi:hypothetical protein